MKSAIWEKLPVKLMSYGMTGSPADPTAAPIGSNAADASVAVAMVDVLVDSVDAEVSVELVEELSVGVVAVGAGVVVLACELASPRLMDWNSTPDLSARFWTWTTRL